MVASPAPPNNPPAFFSGARPSTGGEIRSQATPPFTLQADSHTPEMIDVTQPVSDCSIFEGLAGQPLSGRPIFPSCTPTGGICNKVESAVPQPKKLKTLFTTASDEEIIVKKIIRKYDTIKMYTFRLVRWQLRSVEGEFVMRAREHYCFEVHKNLAGIVEWSGEEVDVGSILSKINLLYESYLSAWKRITPQNRYVDMTEWTYHDQRTDLETAFRFRWFDEFQRMMVEIRRKYRR
jgi:hypothetical protein